jgi:thymidine kinase
MGKRETILNSLLIDCIAERALMYLFAEQNLLSEQLLRDLAEDIGLDVEYLEKNFG